METHKVEILNCVDQIGYGTHNNRCAFSHHFLPVANKFFQNKVYSRTADSTSINLITDSGRIYHKKIYAKYSWKYERAQIDMEWSRINLK